MCGRYTLASTPQALVEQFELGETPALAPRFNVAPGQQVPVVRRDREGVRRLELRRWGLLPGWAKQPELGLKLINARLETAAEKPAFRRAFRLRRCLLPADGFYEWQGARGGRRRPHWLHLPGSDLFAFAGLAERWHGEGGEVIDSCAVLTMPANASVAPLHDRMPVVVCPERYADWLDPARRDPADLRALLAGAEATPWQTRPVSAFVNDVKNEGPECLAAPEPEPRDPQLALFGGEA